MPSCSFILRCALKIKKPKNESLDVQIKYLERHDLSTENLYQFQENFKRNLLLGKYPLYNWDTTGFQPIQTRVYGYNGKPISNWASCYGKVSSILKGDTVIPLWPNLNQKLNLDSIIQNIVTYNKKSSSFDEYKITFVSIWAVYLGTPSLTRLTTIDSFCNSNHQKFRHIKVNLGEL